MHLSDGELQAFTDHQLDESSIRRVETHLAACPACRSRAQAAQERALRMHARLNHLGGRQPAPTNLLAARLQFARRLQQEQVLQETQPMLKKLALKVSRPAWVAIALVAVLVVAMAFPSVRAAANSFLQLFRVEQVRILPVDMNVVTGNMDNSAKLEALFADSVETQKNGEPKEAAGFEEAADLAGFPLRQLTGAEGQPRYFFQPGGSLTFKVDVETARRSPARAWPLGYRAARQLERRGRGG